MAPTLTSISPASGPPGAAITLAGTGFAAGSQAACPALVQTVLVNSTTLTASIPLDLAGAAGSSLAVNVFVQNLDGSTSNPLPFTLEFPSDHQQTFTTIDAVCGEVPQFKRGGSISDKMILGWMRTIAQSIAGAMLKRGLPLDPAQWQQPDGTGTPAPSAVLDMINRLGAAARLTVVIGGQFSQTDWGLAKNLQAEYIRELTALKKGDYDKLFRPAAATVESLPQVSVGEGFQFFRKDKEF